MPFVLSVEETSNISLCDLRDTATLKKAFFPHTACFDDCVLRT